MPNKFSGLTPKYNTELRLAAICEAEINPPNVADGASVGKGDLLCDLQATLPVLVLPLSPTCACKTRVQLIRDLKFHTCMAVEVFE